jgi:hypothetical protein
MIHDIMEPLASQIDLEAIEARLRNMHRFSNDPRALTVHTHRVLVRNLAHLAGEPDRVQEWCLHHDDHEAVTGDIPGPLKALIGTETSLLKTVEHKLDHAICEARQIRYPSRSVRTRVHVYDKRAETIEWTLVLGNDLADWNAPLDIIVSQQHEMLQWARNVV